jgi:translation initiation factor 2 gamma subunit (eIF-2gamma)
MDEEYQKFISTEIQKRVIDLRARGATTSKGEPMSLAAIGRTLDPPVTRTSMYNIRDGRAESKRIKAAIERELDRAYWIRRKAA